MQYQRNLVLLEVPGSERKYYVSTSWANAIIVHDYRINYCCHQFHQEAEECKEKY